MSTDNEPIKKETIPGQYREFFMNDNHLLRIWWLQKELKEVKK